MLKITVPGDAGWDEENECFVELQEPVELMLEHSLLSISKWEMKYHKCFFKKGLTMDVNRPPEETLDYIRCMTITKGVDPDVYRRLTRENINDIIAYINDTMTATHFNRDMDGGGRRHSNEMITSDLIYYWMTALQIPFSCEKWHINRLLTLVEICNRKQGKPKKMSARQVMAQNRALNEARKAKYGTHG